MELQCICCGNTVKRVYPDEMVSGNPDQDMWDSAVVDKMTAGYGSKFDMTKFIIAICDSCVDKYPERTKRL